MSVTHIQIHEEGLARGTQLACDSDQPCSLFLDDLARPSRRETNGGCRSTTRAHNSDAEAKGFPASAEFYEELLGVKMVGATALLSGRSDEERQEGTRFANPFAHVTFKVSSLDELRDVYKRVVERGIPIRHTVNHGCSFAIHFGGPNGITTEVYWPTGELSISGRPCPGETAKPE